MGIPTGKNLIPIPMGMGIPMGIPIPTATLAVRHGSMHGGRWVPPDESPQWDETTHITSHDVGPTRSG